MSVAKKVQAVEDDFTRYFNAVGRLRRELRVQQEQANAEVERLRREKEIALGGTEVALAQLAEEAATARAEVERLRRKAEARGELIEQTRAKVERLRRELDRAVEVRENANTVSVRVEMENKRLREALANLLDASTRHLDGEVAPLFQAQRAARAALGAE